MTTTTDDTANFIHMGVFFDFLAALGVDADEARRLTSPLGEMPPRGRVIAADDYYVELATYGLSVEAPDAEFCERICRALRDHYGFHASELAWFSIHAALDADQGAAFQRYVAKAAAAPEGLARVRRQTLAMSVAVKHVWNGFDAWCAAA